MEYTTQTQPYELPVPQEAASSARPLIVFDWDGTLADSMELCVAEIRLALEQMGLPALPREELMKCNGPAFTESAKILHIPETRQKEFIAVRQKAEMTILDDYQKLFPHAADMVAALSEKANLAIVSNGLTGYIHRSLEITGIARCFHTVQALIPGKTKTEALALTLARIAPRRAVMVGDMLGDIQAGKSNSLPTVAACYGYGKPDEWAVADQKAATVPELQKLLMAFACEG